MEYNSVTIFCINNWWYFSLTYYISYVGTTYILYKIKGYAEQDVGELIVIILFGSFGPCSLVVLTIVFIIYYIDSHCPKLDKLLNQKIFIESKKKKLQDELDKTI